MSAKPLTPPTHQAPLGLHSHLHSLSSSPRKHHSHRRRPLLQGIGACEEDLKGKPVVLRRAHQRIYGRPIPFCFEDHRQLLGRYVLMGGSRRIDRGHHYSLLVCQQRAEAHRRHGSHISQNAHSRMAALSSLGISRWGAGILNLLQLIYASNQAQSIGQLKNCPSLREISSNARYFTFSSQRSLSDYGNRDAHSAQPDQKVFQFDSANAELSCASCEPRRARPEGVLDRTSSRASWSNTRERGEEGGRRARSRAGGWGDHTELPSTNPATSQTLPACSSTHLDALPLQHSNNLKDVYEFEQPEVSDCNTSSKTYQTSVSCVALISSGASQQESAFLDASKSGDEFFFLTNAHLLKANADTAFDVYDAHLCSVSSPCPPPLPPTPACERDSSQNPISATAKALKAHKKNPKHKRPSCEHQAHEHHAATNKATTNSANANAKPKQTGQAQRGRAHR